MIRVRFPNGQCVTYNNGRHVEHFASHNTIRTKKGGDLIACVPYNCILEWVKPCSVTNPLDGDQLEAVSRVVEGMADRRAHTSYKEDAALCRMKKALRSFDMLRRRWK